MDGLKQILITAASDLRTYIAFGSLVFAIIAYRRHKRKRLIYEILSNAALFTVREEVRNRIKITLDEKPVEYVHLVVIRITNAGNEAISSKDFETPVSINFGNKATILSAEISQTDPSGLPAQISYNESLVELKPLLMNEKDNLTIKALVSKGKAPIVDARIAGIRELEDRTGKIQIPGIVLKRSILLGLIMALTSTLIFYVVKPGPFPSPEDFHLLFKSIGVFRFILVMIFSLLIMYALLYIIDLIVRSIRPSSTVE
jgi:hypothetical protein